MLQPPRPNASMPNKEIALLLGDGLTQIEDMWGAITNINEQISVLSDNTPIVPTVTPQAVNQLWNGDISHSVNSWVNGSATDNSRYECQSWFSHPVVAGQAMFPNTTLTGNATKTFLDTDISVANDRITIALHGWQTGTAVLFTSTSPPPALTTNTVYYIIKFDDNRFRLATSYDNAIANTYIDFSGGAGGAVTSTLAYNYTLKENDHTLYSEGFSDWSWGLSPDVEASAGTARFQGSYSIDAQLQGYNMQPGYTYYGVFNIVKQNQYVTTSGSERIWCGLYANQGGGWDWIKGDFEIDFEVNGTVATPTSRNYRILCKTDRGFTVRSTVLNVPNAPDNTDFNNGATVFLSWRNVLQYGVQTYEIYRETGGTYVLLQTITTGITSTLDNGSFESSAVGWPAATFDNLVAYTATIPDVIESLPYSGDPLNPLWATIPFTLKVPQTYDLSTTTLTDFQWLRWGFSSVTGNLDLRLTDGVLTSGDPEVTSAAGQFTADMVGLTMNIYLASDTILATTITAFNSATSVDVSPSPPDDGTDKVLYIYGGAPAHALWIDLCHLSWQLGAAFAPAAIDIDGTHGVPPVTPNGTTQGGSGGGQVGIDGQPVCLFEDELVLTKEGDVLAKDLRKGMRLPNGYGGLNTIQEIIWGLSDIWLVKTENGVELKATDTKQIFTSKSRKKVLAKLKKGDKILTMVNNVLQPSAITQISRIASKQMVVQISLKPTEKFLAGTNGYVLVSNRKPDTSIPV